MTLQWTLVAAFLYSEIAFIILLLLPIISPRVWKTTFNSRICQAFAAKANLYFTIFIAILVLFFIDSIREMHKYSGTLDSEHGNFDMELQLSMKLFRSQRNYYIAGFALFLWLVIRRLIILILEQATLMADIEAAMRQAQSATDQAESLRKEKEEIERMSKEAADNFENTQKEALEKTLTEVRNSLVETEAELQRTKANLTAMKKQANAVSSEYDALLSEHAKLQEEYGKLTGGSGDKKDD